MCLGFLSDHAHGGAGLYQSGAKALPRFSLLLGMIRSENRFTLFRIMP
jgi:hypothetical protein